MRSVRIVSDYGRSGLNATPTISVVIPAFNAEDYLERTLHSALSQAYQNLEVILVNDGSTDSTLAIAQKAASEDGRVKIVSIRNGGVAWARNHGIERATGQFVAFLDADDLWHPMKLVYQVAALTSGEGTAAAAAYTRMRIIDWDDRVIRNGGYLINTAHTLAYHMYARPVGNGSSLLVRKQVAEEINGFDMSLRARGVGGCEDLDFELKIAARYPIVALSRFLVGYRSHAGNMSTQRLGLAASVLTTIEHHLLCHPELPTWAVRKIRSATLEFALQNIAGMHRTDLFVQHAIRLFSIDPYRSLTFGTHFFARKLLRPALELLRASAGPTRPNFYELDPDLEGKVMGRSRRARDAKIVNRLNRLDYVHRGSQSEKTARYF